MVTKNNDHVSEGPNNDQMKYLLYAALHTLEQQKASAAIVVWSGGQMR